jgi:AcrR family transcriptional regulator
MVLTRNGEATRERLIEAALALYAERGYAGTCLDAILERASSSKGAFYHHFDSKEDLTARALSRYWQALLDVLDDAWSEGGSLQARLERLLKQLGASEETLTGCPIGLLGFEARSLPPQVQQALREGLAQWCDRLAARLTEAGVGNPRRARALAERLFVLFEGGVLVERMSGSCCALKSALASWRDEVLAAVRLPRHELRNSVPAHGNPP